MKKRFERIRDWANRNEGLIALIALLVALAGRAQELIAPHLPSSVEPLAAFFQQYGPIFTWLGVLIAGLALWRILTTHKRRLASIEDELHQNVRTCTPLLHELDDRLTIVENLPETLLNEAVAANLDTWCFDSGQWTSDEDGLSITLSPLGGICKLGASWKDYILSFEFKIVNHCAAWIVRANRSKFPPTGYVMIQCGADQIRPHTCTTVRRDGNWQQNWSLVTEKDHGLSLVDWNKARTLVVGNKIQVWINDTLVWEDPQLLTRFPTGTVGFRQWAHEHAIFRKIRVERPQIP